VANFLDEKCSWQNFRIYISSTFQATRLIKHHLSIFTAVFFIRPPYIVKKRPCVFALFYSTLFLADRTWVNGRAYGMVVVCPSSSVVCLSRMYCGWTSSRSGSARVSSNMALATSYRLSIVIMSLSAAVWRQVSLERLKLGYKWPCLGNGER